MHDLKNLNIRDLQYLNLNLSYSFEDMINFSDMPFSFNLEPSQKIRHLASFYGLNSSINSVNKVFKLTMNLKWSLVISASFFYNSNNPRFIYWNTLNGKSRHLYTYLIKKTLNNNNKYFYPLGNSLSRFNSKKFYFSDSALNLTSPRFLGHRLIDLNYKNEIDFTISTYHNKFDKNSYLNRFNKFWLASNGLFKEASFFISCYEKQQAQSPQKFFLLKKFWSFLVNYKAKKLKVLLGDFYPKANIVYINNINNLYINMSIKSFYCNLVNYINYDKLLYKLYKLLLFKNSFNLFDNFNLSLSFMKFINIQKFTFWKRAFIWFKKKFWGLCYWKKFSSLIFKKNLKKNLNAIKLDYDNVLFLFLKLNLGQNFNLFFSKSFNADSNIVDTSLKSYFDSDLFIPLVSETCLFEAITLNKVDLSYINNCNYKFTSLFDLTGRRHFHNLWKVRLTSINKKYNFGFFRSIGFLYSCRKIVRGSLSKYKKIADNYKNFVYSPQLLPRVLNFMKVLPSFVLFGIQKNLNMSLNFFLYEFFDNYFLNLYNIFFNTISILKKYMTCKYFFISYDHISLEKLFVNNLNRKFKPSFRRLVRFKFKASNFIKLNH